MRALIENAITKDDAKVLLSTQLDKQDFNNPIIRKVLNKIETVIGERDYSSPSYLKIEASENGHDWHKDTGSNNHMKWCNYGCSLLIKKSEEGIFKYKSPSQEYSQKEHYLNIILHSSDEWHKREKATKGRTVLLMFLK